VGGWTYNEGSIPDGSGATVPALALTRYNASGTLDPTFGTGGIAITSVLPTITFTQGFTLQGLALQADGKILFPYLAPAVEAVVGIDAGLARFLDMDLSINGPSLSVSEQPLSFTASFDSQQSDDVTGITWDFGDGTALHFHSVTDPGALNVTHSYDDQGIYTLTLTIRFRGGGQLQTTTTVTIYEQEEQGDRPQSDRSDLAEICSVADLQSLFADGDHHANPAHSKSRVHDLAIEILGGGR
jgi:hypothetical protein